VSPLLLLLAGTSWAVMRAPAALPRAAASPVRIMAAPGLSPSLTPSLLPASSPPLSPALSAPADAPRMAREVMRDEMAAKLKEAGLPRLLAEHGLVAWHILPHRSRSGLRVWLTVGLPREGREFWHGPHDEGRRAELSRRLAEARQRATALVAGALGLPEDDVAFNERLLEGCCGAGCGSCLLMQEEHARPWTGEKARPER
jgi:hypothetical protein